MYGWICAYVPLKGPQGLSLLHKHFRLCKKLDETLGGCKKLRGFLGPEYVYISDEDVRKAFP